MRADADADADESGERSIGFSFIASVSHSDARCERVGDRLIDRYLYDVEH